MRLSTQIRLKERQAQVARRAFEQSMTELRRAWRRKLASRTALVLGFSGGLAAGFWRGGRRRHVPVARPPGEAAASGVRKGARRMRASLPPHWLGHYLVWPFLLSAARDFLVARRPGRQSS